MPPADVPPSPAPGEAALPCPFCGGTALLESVEHGKGSEVRDWYYRCRSCACEGPWFKTHGLALRFWNTRFVKYDQSFDGRPYGNPLSPEDFTAQEGGTPEASEADGPDGYTAGWNAAKAHYEYILSLMMENSLPCICGARRAAARQPEEGDER